jgi:hypothetical protein
MIHIRKQWGVLLVASVGALAVVAGDGFAQRYTGPFFGGVNPYFSVPAAMNLQQQLAYTQLLGRAYGTVPHYGSPYGNAYANPYTAYTTPYAAATMTSTAYPGYDPSGQNPYSPYGGGGANPYYGYSESPTGGYLRGSADVINATGRFLVNQEQANLLKEQVKREKLETRKRWIANWLYERENLPTPEDERERLSQIQIRRSLNDPPSGEIWSGLALNTLLADIQKKIGKEPDFRGPQIPLEEDIVLHINVTGLKERGNTGLLKREGRLTWPLALQGDQFKADRDLLNDLTPQVYQQANSGRVDRGTLEEMTKAVQHLHEELANNIKDLTPAQYSEARRFLGSFDDALLLLRQPGAGEYFNQKAPKGKSIGELIQHMSSKGLYFAPALAGDEPAYAVIHRALAAYHAAANSQVATTTTEKPEKGK